MQRTRRIETVLATLAIAASLASWSVVARAGRRPDYRPDVQQQPVLREPHGDETLAPYTGPRSEPSGYDRPNGYPHPRYGRNYRYRTDYYDVPRRYVSQWENRTGE